MSTRFASRSDRPTSWPWARRNVNAIPPPTSSRSTRPRSDSIRASLSETLAPPRIATSGRAGRVEDPREGGELLLHEEPGHGRPEMPRDALRRGVGPVRGGEGVVHVDVAEPRQRPRERGIVRLLARVEAEVLEEEHAARRQRPGLALDGRADAVRGQRDGLPEERPEAPRHGGERELRLRPALSGRPRCEATTIARAPRARAWRSVGSAARIRASSLTSPSRPSGTLKSTRTNTRRSRRSRSSIVRLDMAGTRRPAGPGRSAGRSLPAPPHEGDEIAHAARVAPLVVVPGEHLHERAVHDRRATAHPRWRSARRR